MRLRNLGSKRRRNGCENCTGCGMRLERNANERLCVLPSFTFCVCSRSSRRRPLILRPKMTRLRLSQAGWKPVEARHCGRTPWGRNSRLTCKRRYELNRKRNNSSHNHSTYLQPSAKQAGPQHNPFMYDHPFLRKAHPSNSAESDTRSLSIWSRQVSNHFPLSFTFF